MKTLFQSVVLLIVSLVFVASQQEERDNRTLPCSLVWKKMNSGDNIPATSVASHKENIYIVGAKFNTSFLLGTFDKLADIKLGSFPLEETLEENEDENSNSTNTSPLSNLTSFEILTNPYECTLEWIAFNNQEALEPFTVKVGESPAPDSFVARASVSEDKDRWHPGGLVSGESEITVAFLDEDELPMVLDEFQVLYSYSVGVILEVSDFTFDTDPFAGSEDFLGVDEMHNYSPATIKQTIKHSKKITETYKITTNRTWTSTYTKTFSLNLIFFKVKKEKKTTYTHSTSETQETTEITEISVSREVEVPPFSTIQACTLISIKECVEVSYTAKAKYSALGMTSANLLNVLKNGLTGARIEGDFVVVDASGRFTAALAMSTEFIIRSYEDAQNCDTIKYNIDMKKRNKK